MANEPTGGDGAGNRSKPLPQHPLIERLKPDPAAPARRTIVLAGLPGNSDREGFQRLYLTASLDYFAEFAVQDILDSETIAPERSSLGLECTQVTFERDAVIHYTWIRRSQPVDDFDLDVRLGSRKAARFGGAPRLPPTLPDGTACDTCHGTCDYTCEQGCVRTAQTDCGQATCGNCTETCLTKCGQWTCTCLTMCHQDICVPTGTCQTCGEATCNCTDTCRKTECFGATCHCTEGCTDSCHLPCY
ncbi:hypothetical protein IVB30_20255 [Bradyrhizobium sp. 200]|uniref:hypothetical protein n=1 Tax=Bradyrhizobium sp. 200 TaxID=2782665 RepID=UPI001FFEBD77|nr:hypothetical protein [Bradyrhizobium sp. 200]UPJ53441.1 hypothetical protein IVB30_20255 [Bradyrhizobium sp. 200]